MASPTAAALSGRTRDTPRKPSAAAFSATAGVPGRNSCQSRSDSPRPTGAMASPARRWAAISRTSICSRLAEKYESSRSVAPAQPVLVTPRRTS